MSRLIFLWLGLLIGLPVQQACAHEVHHAVETAEVVAVRLTYADGSPFAFEAYEVYPEGRDIPAHVGRTDGAGRALFVPAGEIGRWRIKAFTADGHGVDLEFTAPAVGNSAAPADASLPRWLRAGFGLALIFGLFGLAQLFLRRKP